MAMLRTAGRLLLGALLGIFYLLGWLAAAVVVCGSTIVAAAQLGWTDVRKRGEHGAA